MLLRVALILGLVACSRAPRAPTPTTEPRGEVAPEVLADLSDQDAASLMLDETHLYWVDRRDFVGSVWRMPRGGGPAQKLAGDLRAPRYAIRVDDELWIAGGQGVIAVPIAGGAVRAIAELYGALALGPDGVYVANEISGLHRITRDGRITTFGTPPVHAIVGGEAVVFETRDGSGSAIWKLVGATPVELARLPRLAGPLARVGDTIYAPVAEDPATAFYAVPIAGGAPRRVARHAFGSTTELTAHAGALWWAASEGLVRLPLDRPTAILYAGASAPSGWWASRSSLVSDDTWWYWLAVDRRRTSGRVRASILRAPRR